ncbi:MAG: YkgJ family cysteine cluster protein [Coriobacteriia bacterium]|nr:YkgJ family cysteine cluster protein [Coriobacteriia bacterium]
MEDSTSRFDQLQPQSGSACPGAGEFAAGGEAAQPGDPAAPGGAAFAGDPAAPKLRFDGDNSYPDCEGCGKCCEYMCVMAVTREELQTMRDYVRDHDIHPIDYNRTCCCFRGPDNLCMIWEARPQVCRLHHCKVPRKTILEQNPSIQVPEDMPLIDVYDTFFYGDSSDPRYRDDRYKGNRFVRFLVALVVVIALAVGAYCFVSKFVLGLESPLTWNQAVQLVTTGRIEKRTAAPAPLTAYQADAPSITYASLYAQGTQQNQLYHAIEDAVLGFQEFDPEQLLTWADAGFDVSSQEAAAQVSALFKQVLNDYPSYSVQYPATPVNSSAPGSYSVMTSGTRFMMRGLFKQPTTQDALLYYQGVLDGTAALRTKALDGSDGSTYDYIQQCFTLLASGMVYSQGGDDGPWYANNIYGALFGGESECVGMSGAFKALMDAQGIPNFIASGQKEGSAYGHAWNVVYYDGSWYVCDLTRCVGDVVSVDAYGQETTTQWEVGQVPVLDTEADKIAAGFMVLQSVYLAGDSVSNAEGTAEFSFGGSITMDDACYQLESAYEARARVT